MLERAATDFLKISDSKQNNRGWFLGIATSPAGDGVWLKFNDKPAGDRVGFGLNTDACRLIVKRMA
jgi:hypothetical protein